MKVRAMTRGQDPNGNQRFPGDVFEVDLERFSYRWMEIVDDDTPVTPLRSKAPRPILATGPRRDDGSAVAR